VHDVRRCSHAARHVHSTTRRLTRNAAYRGALGRFAPPPATGLLSSDSQNKRRLASGPLGETKCKGKMRKHNFEIPSEITGVNVNPSTDVTYDGFAVPHGQESSLAGAQSRNCPMKCPAVRQKSGCQVAKYRPDSRLREFTAFLG
jgi:hypothetical protein